MANFQDVPSSFFMFYIDDFSTKLSIPLAFANEYKAFLQQASLELRSEHSARSWAVKAKKTTNDKWFLKGGWSKFATDNHLVAGNFLTFNIVGESALEVSIFRGDSCTDEAEPPSPPPSPPLSDSSDDEGRPTRIWRYVRELKPYHFRISRMEIPSVFAWGTGLSKVSKIMVEYRGRRWPVRITDRRKNVFSITRGWMKFVKGSELEVGDILMFKFVPNSRNVVEASVVEGEYGKRLLDAAKKGGLIMD